jgi:hypothetical protein
MVNIGNNFPVSRGITIYFLLIKIFKMTHFQTIFWTVFRPQRLAKVPPLEWEAQS